MKNFIIIGLSIGFIFSLLPSHIEAKKKKSKKSKLSEAINPKTLKCLICQTVMEEMDDAIYRVDPKKMVDVGSYRVKSDGSQGTKSIPYARSQYHLLELTEKICEKMEDYAQAYFKKSKKPTLIKMVTNSGNLNPNFNKVDVVKDEDLNSQLKSQCEAFVEENEDEIYKVLKDGSLDSQQEVCVNNTDLCDKIIRDEL